MEGANTTQLMGAIQDSKMSQAIDGTADRLERMKRPRDTDYHIVYADNPDVEVRVGAVTAGDMVAAAEQFHDDYLKLFYTGNPRLIMWMLWRAVNRDAILYDKEHPSYEVWRENVLSWWDANAPSGGGNPLADLVDRVAEQSQKIGDE